MADRKKLDSRVEIPCYRYACTSGLPSTHVHKDTGELYCHVCARKINEANGEELCRKLPAAPQEVLVCLSHDELTFIEKSLNAFKAKCNKQVRQNIKADDDKSKHFAKQGVLDASFASELIGKLRHQAKKEG